MTSLSQSVGRQYEGLRWMVMDWDSRERVDVDRTYQFCWLLVNRLYFLTQLPCYGGLVAPPYLLPSLWPGQSPYPEAGHTLEYCNKSGTISCPRSRSSTVFLLQCIAVNYNTLHWKPILYNTVQYSAMQCNAVQCSRMQCDCIELLWISFQCSEDSVQCNAVLSLVTSHTWCTSNPWPWV